MGILDPNRVPPPLFQLCILHLVLNIYLFISEMCVAFVFDFKHLTV